MKLLPAHIIDNEVAMDDFSYFFEDLPSQATLAHEILLWKTMWGNLPKSEHVTSIHQCYLKCNVVQYPNIKTILCITCTFPVTSCESERSFSALKRLKTYLRATMHQERLNGLSLMLIHKYITVDIKRVIDAFATRKPRRMTLRDILAD